MWQTAIEIAARCGGDRSTPGLMGPASPPAAAKPGHLIVMESEGWPMLDAASRTALETLMESLRSASITILTRRDHPLIEAFEQGIAEGRAIAGAITSWENRWGHRALLDQNPAGISARAQAVLAKAEALRPADYAAALAQREEAQARFARIAPMADAVISFACPGPAPAWAGDTDGQPLALRPTGDAVVIISSSMLFAPAVTIPLLAVGGLPVGVQIMGQMHQDARMTGIARWLHGAIDTVSV